MAVAHYILHLHAQAQAFNYIASVCAESVKLWLTLSQNPFLLGMLN